MVSFSAPHHVSHYPWGLQKQLSAVMSAAEVIPRHGSPCTPTPASLFLEPQLKVGMGNEGDL